MEPRVEPYDYHKCFHCGADVLAIAIWSEAQGIVKNLLVNGDFDYEFEKRDFKDRLVCFNVEKAMAAEHRLVCKGLQSGGNDTDEEPKPYQGPRSKG